MRIFEEDPECLVFIISLKAGGEGLNLVAANNVLLGTISIILILVDPWWNPAVEDQATMRAFRIGQKKDV